MICPKSGLPLVSFFHANIVKTPMDIEFSEVLGPLKLIDEFGEEGKWVLVFHCDHIQCLVVLYKSE